jgi:5-formyltetrahydrofolate cyclo-ligase
MATRQELRQQLRQQRRALPPTLRAQLSQTICQHICRDRAYQRAQHIALYLATDGEVDVSYLIRDAWQRGKQVYLPVLGLRHTGRLWFVPFAAGDALYWNRFGIAEPVHHQRDRYQPLRRIDLVVLPLVGFDMQGHRLGMGGGFYDRSLAHRARASQHWHRPRCCGVAFDMQQLAQIESHPWDVPLDTIATETGLRHLR